MSKFKVGDRVRLIAIRSGFGVRGGDWGTVAENNSSCPYVDWDRVGTRWAFRDEDLELIANAFKPGDRVVRVDEWFGNFHKGDVGIVRECNGEDIYFEGDSRRYATGSFAAAPLLKVGDKVLVKRTDYTAIPAGTVTHIVEIDADGNADLWCADYPEGLRFYASEFEAAPTLRIEAGKFYKTRDGRKVGPMRKRNGFFDSSGSHYSTSGTYGYQGGNTCTDEQKDLIAEWDEPVAVAPATATPSAKFKVGDRVKTQFGVGTIVDADNSLVPYLVRHDEWTGGRGRGDGEWWFANKNGEDFTQATPTNTAIVCILRDGNPLPASRPHVHQSVAEAKVEAERLARTSPGDTFAVYERVSSVSATVTLSEAA